MKTIKQAFVIAGSVLAIAACQNPDQDNQSINSDKDMATDNTTTAPQSYIDPNTGAPVDLYYDAENKMTYNAQTNEPVAFYINTNTNDTIYGQGRYVVNGYITRTGNGEYQLDESKVKKDGDELKMKDGDVKLKIDGSEMKYKNGDYKYKTDGDETKIKDGDYKKKTDGDETKVKDGDSKMKSDSDETDNQ